LTCLLCAARPKAPAEQFSQALVPNPFRAEYDDLAAFLKEVHPETLTIFGGSAPCSRMRASRAEPYQQGRRFQRWKGPKSGYRRESSDSNKQLG
jgi:hypothetical protein